MSSLVKIDSQAEWQSGVSGYDQTVNILTDFTTDPGWFMSGMGPIAKTEYRKTYSELATLTKLTWAKTSGDYVGRLFVASDLIWYPVDPDSDPYNGINWALLSQDLTGLIIPGLEIRIRLHLWILV